MLIRSREVELYSKYHLNPDGERDKKDDKIMIIIIIDNKIIKYSIFSFTTVLS